MRGGRLYLRGRSILGVALWTMMLLAVASAPGQSPLTEVPRMSDGQPNLTGLWEALGTAHWDIRDHVSGPAPFFQLGALGATPAGQGVVQNGEIPYLPDAAAKQRENYENRWELDPALKCYMPGVPRATYMPFPFQIIQSTNRILIAYEFATANRTINMGEPRPDVVDSWMGTSNGRWEGDTLVVDVTGLNGEAWFDHAGNFASNAAHIQERYTPVGPNHLMYEARIQDDAVFSRPWTIRLPLYRRVEQNAQLLEFKCVEFAEELLYGNLRRKDK
jgi:hypothetical protein